MLKKIQAKLLPASRALLVFCCTLFILLTTIAPAAGEQTHERRTVRVRNHMSVSKALPSPSLPALLAACLTCVPTTPNS